MITRTVSDLETIADIFSEGLISMIGDSLQVVVIVGREIDGGIQHLAHLPVRILGVAAKTRAGRQLGQVDFLAAQRFGLGVE